MVDAEVRGSRRWEIFSGCLAVAEVRAVRIRQGMC